MCRNIKVLFNFEPPATEAEIREASLQFVRKVSGYRTPSAANEAAFRCAVEEISHATTTMLDELVIHAPPKSREAQAERARFRAQKRFGTPAA